MTPRVSILLPAYNAGATIDACLRSIVRQREPDWQCVAVDDGSTDDTLERLRAWAARTDRIEVLAMPHRGLVEALRTGLEACRGRFIARMDADDLMHRERLKKQAERLEADASIAAVGCRVRIFPRAGLPDGRRTYERWLNRIDSAARLRLEAFIECPIAHPTLMIRREVMGGFGYRDRGWPEDYDLVLRLLAAGLEIGVVPERLLSWRDHPGRLSRTGEAYRLERFTACKAAFLAGGVLRASDRYLLWGHGPTGRALKKALRAHGKEPSHIVEIHPRRLGNVIAGAPVIPPEALPALRGRPMLVSVAGEEARGQIRAALAVMDFVEGLDYLCTA